MRRLPNILLGLVLAGLAVLLTAGVLFYPKWKEGSYRGGQAYAEPFRIAGNFYFVGATDIAAFLIAGPDGHVLIDGGYPLTPSLITRSIGALGFDIKDVRILLNSHSHFDHAGGLKALQDASGAELWISEPEAGIVASGGSGDPYLGPLRYVFPILKYPAPRVDRRFTDGDGAFSAWVTGRRSRFGHRLNGIGARGGANRDPTGDDRNGNDG
jgi:metallo-beta-lactamase class B